MASQLNPAVLAQLIQQAQQTRQAPPPVQQPQPNMTDVLEKGIAQATQKGMDIVGSADPMMASLTENMKTTATAPYQTPDPKYGPSGTLGKLGVALLNILGPHQMGTQISHAMYGPGQRARQAEMATRIEELKGLQDASSEVGKREAVGAGMIYHPLSAAARPAAAEISGQSARDVARIHADTALAGFELRHQDVLARIEAQKDIAAASNDVNELIARIRSEAEIKGKQIAASAGISETQARGEYMLSAANLISARNPSIGEAVMGGLFGFQAPMAPGGSIPSAPTTSGTPSPTPQQQSKAGDVKKTQQSKPPAGATGIAPGSDGKNHYHDAQGKNLGVAP